MTDLTAQRRFYAEEVQIAANVQNEAVVEALATVARERFLPPGPWTVRGEGDMGQPLRQTRDADPKHVYHNLAIGIDPTRMLFNGAPGLLAMAIDSLALAPGSRVLHIGTGTGYYTAVMAHCVGPTGRVLGIEVDASLAAQASANLAPMSQVEVRLGNGRSLLDETFDAILVNAGVTHPLDAWLDALARGGRMILPLTVTLPAMNGIGKGILLHVAKAGEDEPMQARVVTFVAIFSALGIRDDALNAEIGKALQKHPFPPLAALTRTPHERTDKCWLHGQNFCLQLKS